MKEIGQSIRLGIWTVKADKIQEFIEAWQSSADWLGNNLPNNGEGFLVQDMESPNRFISFAFSDNLEKAQEVMSQIEYLDLFSKVRAICDDVQPHGMKIACYSSSKKNG